MADMRSGGCILPQPLVTAQKVRGECPVAAIIVGPSLPLPVRFKDRVSIRGWAALRHQSSRRRIPPQRASPSTEPALPFIAGARDDPKPFGAGTFPLPLGGDSATDSATEWPQRCPATYFTYASRPKESGHYEQIPTHSWCPHACGPLASLALFDPIESPHYERRAGKGHGKLPCLSPLRLPKKRSATPMLPLHHFY